MSKSSSHTFLKFLTLLTFLLMIALNVLANILPINGITTGAVSDAYPNLFAPAGVTFSIWGLIYLLLAVYVGYQFVPKSAKREQQLRQLNLWFSWSSLANAAWILAWHHQLIWLSVPLMLVILYALIKISSLSDAAGLSARDRLFIKIPFGVYFGWITVATIANITTWLVSLGWSDWWLSDQIWTVLVLVVGAAIAGLTTLRTRNLAYGLVPIWAYFGIYLKHTTAAGFDYAYPPIVVTAIACIALLMGVNGWVLRGKWNGR